VLTILLDEHHGVVCRFSKMGENFGVTGEVVSRKIHCFFIYGACNYGVNGPCHCGVYCSFDGLKSGLAGDGGDYAKLQCVDIYVVQVDDVDSSVVEFCLFMPVQGFRSVVQ